MRAYDLAVAYRVYPKVAKSAQGLPYSDDKFRLSEICLRSFSQSLGNLHVRFWALLDGCPEEYSETFQKYFNARDLTLVSLPGIGNQATFAKQIEILSKQDESEFVYFAEDDYLYLPQQIPRMIAYLQDHDDVHFVTPYDHPDCYALSIHRHPKWMRVSSGHHWRTAGSTCLTFLTRRDTLRRKAPVFRSYCRGNYDCSLWLSLTKYSLFNPWMAFRYLREQPLLGKIIVKAWAYCFRQILFGSRMKLWVPIPGIGSHLDARALSPAIDWIALLKVHAEAITREKSENAARANVSEAIPTS